jgi:hypothetical protein
MWQDRKNESLEYLAIETCFANTVILILIGDKILGFRTHDRVPYHQEFSPSTIAPIDLDS